MARALQKIFSRSFRKHVPIALRVAAVVFCAAVVAVAAAVRHSLGPVGVAIAAVITLIAGSVVAVGVKDGAKSVYWRTLARKRSSVARQVSGAPRHVDVLTQESADAATQGPGKQLGTYLRDRLVAGQTGPPLVIVTGAEGTRLAQVVREVSESLGPAVQLIEPLGDGPDEIRAFAKWLVDGANEDLLPHWHARSEATLFLLGDLDGYRGTGLEPDRFETWRDPASPRLGLATVLRDAASSQADPEWANDLFRRARVIPILEDSEGDGRAPV